MKKIKGVKLFIFSILVCTISLFTTKNVYAVEETIILGPSTMTTQGYIAGVHFQDKRSIDGDYLYCLDMPKNTAQNTTATLKGKRDNGITTILKNGYPYKSITGDEEKDYYITQTAIWWYLDETTGSSNLGEQFKSEGSDAYDMRKYVKELVELGVANKDKEETTKTISLEVSSKKLTLNDNYYISDKITIKKSEGLSNIKVTLTNTPEGTLIVDENGNEIKDFSNIEYFYIKIPKDKVTSSSTYNVKIMANYDEYQSYEYLPEDTTMQNIAILVKDTNEVNSSVTLSASVEIIVVPNTSTTSLIITIAGILVISSGIVLVKKHAK